jgi:hypothetical protein
MKMIQRFRISPTFRSAIFRAKRWFYATFCKNCPKEIIEENKKMWVQLASKLIEESNKLGISDKPTRLEIEYEVVNGKFKPIKATVEAFEMKSLGKHTISI